MSPQCAIPVGWLEAVMPPATLVPGRCGRLAMFAALLIPVVLMLEGGGVMLCVEAED